MAPPSPSSRPGAEEGRKLVREVLWNSKLLSLSEEAEGDLSVDWNRRILWGFYNGFFMGFYGDLLGFISDLYRIYIPSGNCDLLGFI